MPILSDGPDWIDPDNVPRPVVTFGAAMAEVGRIELELHRHMKGQVLFVQRGALSCEVEGGLWIVPPRSAVWIPGGALHAIKASGALEGFAAFVDPAVSRGLPEVCCAVSVAPLLRELLIRSASLPALYEEGGANSRLMAALLDELAAAKIEDLHLPMPTDARLRRIVDLMMASPADRGTLDVWAKRAGLSERTLARLISRETGMSFGRWRQQLGVILAVKWLASGASIQQVAADLGYESAPSFVTMFRKALGTSPGRYMAERSFSRH
ncbi:transcriptional regulator, AraC family [Methylocella silvestris BL2]|uniref:Transcriptional regulator, AraC family n=1 Tax=Methylocella silvestris (strain DSM 15510 / CIP 108128 / LMG 27833 / NCIMB 13906 / BL2) TaxID=395965 RepID=B8ESG5_METSB|nr:helix-turn-helix transcriptional regulator [Methylocella silvestris]ACK49855.1 transcriptional regulator, AraC family [Methylocella silvestris BL2]